MTRRTHLVETTIAAGHIVAHLAAARETGGVSSVPRSFREVDPGVVRLWPAWVGRAAVLKSRGTWWLWCVPRKAARGAGQVVIDLPAGRYLVDIMDTRTHAWFSRESAAGAPLVAGLPATSRPVIARIRCVARQASTSAGDAP